MPETEGVFFTADEWWKCYQLLRDWQGKSYNISLVYDARLELWSCMVETLHYFQMDGKPNQEAPTLHAVSKTSYLPDHAIFNLASVVKTDETV